jgi:PPM family protein phosphatase
MTLTLEFSAATHPGLRRDNNEDCFLSAPEFGVWAVADGMGGHEAGEVASAIVQETISKQAQKQDPFSLTEAIQLSHKEILQSAERGVGAFGMGSTVVALSSQGLDYEVAWVGDSRAYLWTDTEHTRELVQLTTDHSYVQLLFASGVIDEHEIENHPDKNIITQCLGMQELELVKVDKIQGRWQPNQWILLCSDGLTDELRDQDIADILAQSPNSFTAVDNLLHEALTNGGNDNITVQIIEFPRELLKADTSGFWGWVPPIFSSRKVDALVFVLSALTLISILFSILTSLI